jgi:cobyrinic acid a,c-diamide synthase
VTAVPRVVIAAPAAGHGTSTVATGLLAAFAARGLTVAPFQVGPDHIDPGHPAFAAGRTVRNLDPVLVGEDRIGPLFAHGAQSAGLAVIEGVAGLYDGRAGGGDTGSTAQVAGLLAAPVILVVDVAAQGRSVAALVHGFRTFGDVRIAGVILNRVGSDRHEALLRDACEEVGTPVLGALHHADVLARPVQDLGPAPAAGRPAPVCPPAGLMQAAVDLDAVLAAARTAPPLHTAAWTPRDDDPVPGRPVVALAGGPAFSSYPETAELLTGAGAGVVTVDPLRDEALPAGTRALVAGGGRPEAYAAELSANEPLRRAVASLAAAGAPVAAEGAGLLWLARSLDAAPMCGVLEVDGATTPAFTRGYRDAVALTGSPLAPAGTRVTGHEFHRTAVHPRSGLLLSPAAGAAWAWRGADPEGFATPTLHASYLHLHWAGTPGMARRFVAAAAARSGPRSGRG